MPDRQRIDQEHPIGGEMSDVVRGLFRRAQITYLLRHYSSTPVLALFSFINGCVSIGIMAVVALVTDEPFVFPSLGPTAFLLFYTPRAPTAAPRNVIIGHAIGAAAGYMSLVVFGLRDAGPAIAVGVTWPRVLAAGLSLGLTSGLMVLARAPHPPAGATTLIVALGILREPWQLVVLMLAVVLLTVQGFAINRLAGMRYPMWQPVPEDVSAPAEPRPAQR